MSYEVAQVKNKREQYGTQSDGCIIDDHLYVYEYGTNHIGFMKIYEHLLISMRYDKCGEL